MKKIFMLFLLSLTASIYLLGQSYLFVSTDELNLRSEPSQYSSTIITILERNEQVEVIDAGETWSKVRFGSIVGYVSSKYLAREKSTNESTVLICNGPSAYAYHNRHCSGLNRCTHSVSSVKSSEAKALGRSPCKNCYSGSSTNSPSSSKSSISTPKSSASSSGGCSSVQCSGTTQKGLRCKNRTTNCNGRCYHH